MESRTRVRVGRVVALWLSFSIGLFGILGLPWGAVWLGGLGSYRGLGGAAFGLTYGASLGTLLGIVVVPIVVAVAVGWRMTPRIVSAYSGAFRA